ncbi:hypothetical protein Fmac_001430 [Flemingia macrophylla]|uniref:G-patch domain-containing protein n=1 Tax=Flemingia macrophylla TaxID=520843 RepID=A0ABD1NH26_9FABA
MRTVAQMLVRTGYQPGQGLGKDSQGIIELPIIQDNLRKQGIGYDPAKDNNSTKNKDSPHPPLGHIFRKASIQISRPTIGWEFLMTPHPNVYPTSTIEFLAFVTLKEITPLAEDEAPTHMVTFWMNRGYHTVSLDEFNVQADFVARVNILQYQAAICQQPDRLHPANMWRECHHPEIGATTTLI